MSGNGHIPVLLEESVEALNIVSDGQYADGTYGRGGHSRRILESLGPQGRLTAFDKDPEAARESQSLSDDPRFTFVSGSFVMMDEVIAELEEEAEDADRVCILKNGKVVANGTNDEIKEDLVHEYIVADSKDRNALEKELMDNNFDYKKTMNGFQIETEGLSPQKVIHKIRTDLTTLKINNPTLEEAYLKIIDNGDEDK